jgi:hypothetical protein
VVLFGDVVEILHPPELAVNGQHLLLMEMMNASGYEACLSVPIVKGR